MNIAAFLLRSASAAFNLDDIGAHIAEQHWGERTGHAFDHVDDSDVRQDAFRHVSRGLTGSSRKVVPIVRHMRQVEALPCLHSDIARGTHDDLGLIGDAPRRCWREAALQIFTGGHWYIFP